MRSANLLLSYSPLRILWALFVQEPPGLEQMSLPFALVVRKQLKSYMWICCGKDVDNYYMLILGRMQRKICLSYCFRHLVVGDGALRPARYLLALPGHMVSRTMSHGHFLHRLAWWMTRPHTSGWPSRSSPLAGSFPPYSDSSPTRDLPDLP